MVEVIYQISDLPPISQGATTSTFIKTVQVSYPSLRLPISASNKGKHTCSHLPSMHQHQSIKKKRYPHPPNTVTTPSHSPTVSQMSRKKYKANEKKVHACNALKRKSKIQKIEAKSQNKSFVVSSQSFTHARLLKHQHSCPHFISYRLNNRPAFHNIRHHPFSPSNHDTTPHSEHPCSLTVLTGPH
jgi:hypothetical protein